MASEIDTPVGTARLHLSPAPRPRALLLLAHGANGGIASVELAAFADQLPGRGISVARFEQPYAVAGRGIAPVAQLDAAWEAALAAARRLNPELPLFSGGRSNGARVACRNFGADQAGLVLSAFPLHPPGRPDRSRIAELAPVAEQALVLQTEGDPFGGADELLAALAGQQAALAELYRIPGRSHGPDTRTLAGRTALPGLLDALVARVETFVAARV